MISLNSDKTLITIQQGDKLYKGETLVANISQYADNIDVSTYGEPGRTSVQGAMGWEVSLQGVGELTSQLAGYGLVDTWNCIYCTSPNPNQAQIRSYRQVEQIHHCLKCGAPRPHFTL